MSFDLYFCRRNDPVPSIPELKDYLSALPSFETNAVGGSEVEFWYQNEATGVYCCFSYSTIDAGELGRTRFEWS